MQDGEQPDAQATQPASIPSPSAAQPSAAVPLLPLPSRGASVDTASAAAAASGRPSQTGTRPSSSRRPASGTGSADGSKSCNCRNSKCLKLYCECFASGRYCSNCNCANCMNNTMHEAARSKAIESILERNANAFRPKISVQQGDDGTQPPKITRHSKGCSCRKSHCLKKYCECFQAGIFCGATCRCKDCRNYEGSEALSQLMEANFFGTSRQLSGALGAPDAKRPRSVARQGSASAAPDNGQHFVPERPDPAREAINNLRGRKMHEVLAHMLTSLHSEAHGKEQARQQAEASAGQGATATAGPSTAAAAPAADAHAALPQAPRPDESVSKYYADTEGTLLSEFGSFLGNLADRIDEQLQKQQPS